MKKLTPSVNPSCDTRPFDLIEYLEFSPFESSLFLTPNRILSFHWSNWEKTCEFFRDRMENCEITQSRLEALNLELDDLRRWKVWLKSKSKMISASLYNLYEAYLDPRLRSTWFDRKEEVLVSLHNESGPYITLSSMRWIDKEIYALFVQRKILTDFVKTRKFRLNTELPVRVYFDDQTVTNVSMCMHQISGDGMLIRIDNVKDLNRFVFSQSVCLEFNTIAFEKSFERDAKAIINAFSRVELNDFRSSSLVKVRLNKEVLKKYNNTQNLKTSDGKNYFIFAKFDDFESLSPHKKDIFTKIKGVVDLLEDHFQSELQKNAA